MSDVFNFDDFLSAAGHNQNNGGNNTQKNDYPSQSAQQSPNGNPYIIQLAEGYNPLLSNDWFSDNSEN